MWIVSDIGKRRQHHFDFRRFEDAGITLHVIVVYFHIRLGEESENLGQQIALCLGELVRPILAILPKRHFLGHPVHLLLALPEIKSPRVTEWLVRVRRGAQTGNKDPDRHCLLHWFGWHQALFVPRFIMRCIRG